MKTPLLNICSGVAMSRAIWRWPLLLCFTLPLSTRLIADGEVAANAPSKAFWLWFDEYVEENGELMDPLEAEQMLTNIESPQVISPSDVVDASSPESVSYTHLTLPTSPKV